MPAASVAAAAAGRPATRVAAAAYCLGAPVAGAGSRPKSTQEQPPPRRLCVHPRAPGTTSHASTAPRSPHLRPSASSNAADAPAAPLRHPPDITADLTMSPTSSTPSILINDSGSLHRHPLPLHRRPFYPNPSGAMAIPRAREEVPPPLPPPRYIGDALLNDGQDAGWQWGNPTAGFGGNRLAAVKPGSSLLGGAVARQAPRDAPGEPPFTAREPSVARSLEDTSPADSLDHSDEDRAGKPRQSLANFR